MTNPYPLPRETRETAPIAGDGRASYGPLGFLIWDVEDVQAVVSRDGRTWLPEAVTAAKVSNQPFDHFTVTFASPLLTGDRAVVQSRRLQKRDGDVTRGGAISGAALERELSVLGTIAQELRRDADRMLRFSPDVSAPALLPMPRPGFALVGNATGDGFENSSVPIGGGAIEIEDVDGLALALRSLTGGIASVVEIIGVADGIAELGPDGKVPAGQLPAVPAPDLSGYQERDEKGVPDGYAGLGPDGRVPASQLPIVPAQSAQPKVFTPYQFGGVGDGVADDSAAVQACFDAVRMLCIDAKYRHPNVQIPMSIDLRGGDWKIVKGIDATNIVAWNLEIQGGLLRGHCTGKAILDLVNSRGYTLRQIGFYGDFTNMPSCAYQMARATPGGFCDNDAFVEVSTTGWYSRTAIHVYAHETAKHDHCTYFNNNPNARVAIWEGFNGVPFTSDYSPVMSGGTSFINNKVDTCDIRYTPTGGYDLFTCNAVTIGANPTFTFTADHNFQVNEKVTFAFFDGLFQLNKEIGIVTARTARTITVSGASTSGMSYSGSGGFVMRCAKNPPVLLSRACDFNFDTSYIVAYGTPHLELAFPDAGFPKLLQIQLNLLFEGSGNTCNVFFNTGNKFCSIQGFKFRTYQAHPKFALFGMSADASARLALYCDDLQSVEQQSNVPIFNDPGKVSIAGVRAIIPAKSLMEPSSFVGFNGTITQLSDGATSQHNIVGAGSGVEETRGTWSPTLRGSNGVAVSDYSATGTWVKVGGLVHFTLNYTINSIGGASNVLQITNMPFPRDAPASFAGRDGNGQGTIGNGGVGNPNLLNIARYDNAGSLVSGAGFMSGSFSTAS